jgi:hypothetical protein
VLALSGQAVIQLPRSGQDVDFDALMRIHQLATHRIGQVQELSIKHVEKEFVKTRDRDEREKLDVQREILRIYQEQNTKYSPDLATRPMVRLVEQTIEDELKKPETKE